MPIISKVALIIVLVVLFIHFWNNRVKARTVVITCPGGHVYEHEIRYGVFSAISLHIKARRWAEKHKICGE